MPANKTTDLPQWTRMSAGLLVPEPQIADYLAKAHAHVAGMKREDGYDVPTYGLLSLHARKMPVLTYSSPALKAAYPKSFTDGEAIFISDDTAKAIAFEEAASLGEKKGMASLVLLHGMHSIMNHAGRLNSFPDAVAQIATETSAYTKMKLGFPNMKWAGCVEKAIAASGLPESTVERYARLPEETIAREILAECARLSPGCETNPGDSELLQALSSLGFKAVLCEHPVCKDRSAIPTAVAEDERQELLRSTILDLPILRVAAERGDVQAVGALLSCCDSTQRGSDGKTALMAAAERGHFDCCAALARAPGAGLMDKDGRNASAMAREGGHKDVADLIERAALDAAVERAKSEARMSTAKQSARGRRL